MEELIFFAIIIIFSIIESIARSRKKKSPEDIGAEGGRLPDPGGWEAEPPELGTEVATYDDEPSYDEVAIERKRREDRTIERYKAPHRVEAPKPAGGPGPAPERHPSTETMLPGDLLEQLEALARGRKVEERKPRTLDLPAKSPPLPPLERTEVGSGRGTRAPVGSTGPVGSTAPIAATEHMVHRSHAGYGTDPSSRAPSEQDVIDPLAERISPDALAVRRQLLGGGRSALRQAVVLKEVLGVPVALRGDHLGP